MIIPMQKYSFLVYHKEYDNFLQDMQSLGLLHIIEKKAETSIEINEKKLRENRIDRIIKFLEKREIEYDDSNLALDIEQTIKEIEHKQKGIDVLQQELIETRKEMDRVLPWGNFSVEIINKLKDENLNLRFFIKKKKKFDKKILSGHSAEIVSENERFVYFVVLQQGTEKLNIDAEETQQPNKSIAELKLKINDIEREIDLINNDLDNYAKTYIQQLKQAKQEITTNIKYEKVVLNTLAGAGNKMKILEAWVPDTKKKQINDFLETNHIVHVIEKATLQDKIPVLLQNNKFTKLFEPIGKLFSLPSYSELDLTVFFAPFFMMFFGFCLGDAGYGLLFVIGAGIYKLKAKKEIKPVLSLVQLLGIATIIFGIISGTFFGINLIKTDIGLLANYKSLFLNPDHMFNLALALGALQIIFGMVVKAINLIKQFGYKHALATFGWLIVFLGGGIYMLLSNFIGLSIGKTALYVIVSIGSFLIVFFSDVESNIVARIGKGAWDIYSTITGVFGDLLSYIRLFALGLSSAILGFVINDIALQILGSSTILGPVFFVIFLLIGHGLNILISSLGSFVHPMRLTFVEFYKNAGFKGGGKEYKPFTV